MTAPSNPFDAMADHFARLARIEAALAFYADPANWGTASHGFAAQYDPEPSAVATDKGQRAREALQ